MSTKAEIIWNNISHVTTTPQLELLQIFTGVWCSIHVQNPGLERISGRLPWTARAVHRSLGWRGSRTFSQTVPCPRLHTGGMTRRSDTIRLDHFHMENAQLMPRPRQYGTPGCDTITDLYNFRRRINREYAADYFVLRYRTIPKSLAVISAPVHTVVPNLKQYSTSEDGYLLASNPTKMTDACLLSMMRSEFRGPFTSQILIEGPVMTALSISSAAFYNTTGLYVITTDSEQN